MKNTITIALFVIFVLVSSLLSSIDFNNYLFIHAQSYIQLAFSIGFTLLLANFTFIARNKKNIPVKFNLVDLFILVFGGYLIIRYAFSPRFNTMPDVILFTVMLSIIYFSMKNIAGNNKERVVKIVLYLIIFIGIFQTVYGVLQLAGILPNLFHYKFGGSFGNPGDLANFLVIPYTLLLGLFFQETKRRNQMFILGFIILHLFLIIISFARTAWIAVTISSLMILYYFKFGHINIRNILFLNKKQLVRYAILLVLTVSLSVLASYKLYNLKSSSANGRIFIWKLCAELIYEKPVFGHGYNSFVTRIHQNQINYFKHNTNDSINGWIAGELVFAFNDYLQLVVEYGLIAFVLLLFILYSIFSFKHSNISNTGQNLISICRAALLAVLMCMLFSYPLQNPTIMLCFIILLASASAFDNKSILGFKIKKIYLLFGTVIFFVFLSFIAISSSRSIIYGLKWKKAFANSKSETGNYILQYEKLFKFLKQDRSFLLNYGSILLKSHNYEKCISHFETYGYLCATTDMYLMLGASYENLKKYPEAEENYKNASFLIPHRFIPKYKLFKHYNRTGQNNKAREIASQIQNMKIKVFSVPVKDIKTEINEYLLFNNAQCKNRTH